MPQTHGSSSTSERTSLEALLEGWKRSGRRAVHADRLSSLAQMIAAMAEIQRPAHHSRGYAKPSHHSSPESRLAALAMSLPNASSSELRLP